MKTETLEEVAERLYPENWESIMDGQHDSNSYERTAFINGAKWQQERMYSEEEILKFSEWIVFEVEHYGCPTEENIIKALKEIKRILRQRKNN